jgi:hypothetical protein
MRIAIDSVATPPMPSGAVNVIKWLPFDSPSATSITVAVSR